MFSRRFAKILLWSLTAVLVAASAGSATGTNDEAQFVQQALTDVAATAGDLAGQGVLGEAVPLTEVDPSTVLDLGQLLSQRVAALGAAFSEADPRTEAGRETMRKELEKLDTSSGAVTVRVGCQGNADPLPEEGCGTEAGTPVTVAEASAGVLDVTVPVHATRTISVPMALDAGITRFDGGALSVTVIFDTTVPLRVDLNQRTLAPNLAVALRAPSGDAPQATIDATVSGTPNLTAALGFTEVTVGLVGPGDAPEGPFTATANLGATFNDPDANGVITREEFQATAISDLATLTRAGTVAGKLTLDTDLISGSPDTKIPFSVTLGNSPATADSPGGSFTFPSLTASDLSKLNPFRNITPEQVIAGIGQAAAGLAGAQQVGDIDLAFLEEGLSEAFKVAEPVFDFVSQQGVVCGTSKTTPPTGEIPARLAKDAEVYCQAFVVHPPTATISDVQWQLRSGVDAAITVPSDPNTTIGLTPSDHVTFKMNNPGAFDAFVTYKTTDTAFTPSLVLNRQSERPARTAQQLLAKLASLSGFDISDDADGRKALAYDEATEALRIRLRKSFNPEVAKLSYEFGDQLEVNTGLIGVQTPHDAKLTADVGTVELDLTVGLLLGDLAAIGQDQGCPDPNQSPCEQSPLDRIFLEVNPLAPEFRVADATFAIGDPKPAIAGRVGFVQIGGRVETFALQRRVTTQDLLAVNITPPAITDSITGLNVGAVNLPNAIRLRELLFKLPSLVPTPAINLKFDGALVAEAKLESGPTLGTGTVTISWPDITQGLPQISADASFNETLKGFNIDPNIFGTHDGAASPAVAPDPENPSETPAAATLVDPTKSFSAELVGTRLENMTDGSFCDISSVTATSLTCDGGLGGGTRNQWNLGDQYRVQSGDPLAMLWQLLDNLDTIVAGIDTLSGNDAAKTIYESPLPLVGVAPKDLVGQVRDLRRTVTELRGGPGAQILCGKTDGNPPTEDPSDLALSLTDTSSDATIYCAVQNAKAATSVQWTLVSGGSTAPTNPIDTGTVVTPTTESTAAKTAAFTINGPLSQGGKLASAEFPQGYRIRAVFTDADGEHVVDFPEQSVPATLQQFETALESKLGIPASSFVLGTTGTGSSRRLTLGLNYDVCGWERDGDPSNDASEPRPSICAATPVKELPGARAPINIDLDALGGLVGVGSQGDVAVSYSAAAVLNLSFAVDPDLDPKVEPGSGLTVKGRLAAPDIGVSATIGPFGINAGINGKPGNSGEGTFKLGADFALSGPTTAVTPGDFVDGLSASFTPPADENCGSIDHDGDGTATTLAGTACGLLSLGLVDGSNVSYLGDVGFTATIASDGTVSVTPYAQDSIATALANQILSWDMLLRALPELLTRIEEGLRATSGSGPDGAKVPIVGDALDAGADVVGTIRGAFTTTMDTIGAAVEQALGDCTNPLLTCVEEPRPEGCSDDPGAPAEEQCTHTEDVPQPTARDVEEIVQKFLWDNLGSLIRENITTAGDIDDIVIETYCSTSPLTACADDAGLLSIKDVRMTFNVGQGVGTEVTDPPAFDLGFDGIPLRVAGRVGASAGWNLLVDVGLSRDEGPYLVVGGTTPGYTTRPEEVLVEASATLKEEQSAGSICGSEIDDPIGADDAATTAVPFVASADRCLAGKLGFVAVNIRDGNGDVGDDTPLDDRTNVSLKTFLDLQKQGGGDRIGFTDLVGGSLQPVVGLDVGAQINLRFRTGIPTDQLAGFPSLVGTFHLDWGYARSVGGAGGDVTGRPLTVTFDHLHVDASEFFEAYLKPTLDEVRNVTGPFKPVIETLNAPLPVVSDLAALVGQPPLTLLGLMEAISDNNLTVVKSLAAFIEFANDDVTASGLISLGGSLPGGFGVNARDARAPAGPAQAASLISIDPAKAGTDLLAKPAVGGDNTAARDRAAQTGAGLTRDNLPGTFGVPGLTFPFMSDASKIFGFVMGQDITLVRYDVGTLRATAGFSYNFGPFFIGPVPVTAGIGGSATLEGRFALGYDTSGIRKVLSGGSGVYLFDGIFIDDLDAAGVDVPEVRLIGTVSARAGVTVFVATAGIEGGITMTVDLNLNDNPEPDGKLRIEEVFNKLSNPICLFDVAGKLEAFLNAFLEINYFLDTERWDFELVRVTLLEFSGSCEPPKPVLATNAGGVLTLHMGPLKADRKISTGEDNEKFVVRPVGGGRFSVEAFGVYQVFGPNAPFAGPAITKIVANGGDGNDTILMEAGTNEELPPGAEGSSIPFNVPVELRGGNHVDVLQGGDADDLLIGGAENDRIEAGKGNDLVYGDDKPGETGTGTAGGDQLSGGRGHDVIFAQGGGDRAQGGPGADYVDGGDDGDVVNGGPGAQPGQAGIEAGSEDLADVLVGGGAQDQLEGSWGGDVLYGDADLQAHGKNSGVAVAAELKNALTGGLFAGLTVVPDNGNLDAACNDAGTSGDTDVLDGGADDDAIFGGAAADKAVGGPGSDTLCGNAGNDELDGDNASLETTGGSNADTRGGNDVLDGGADHDVLRGRGGHDTVRGAAGHDVLFAGGGSDELLGGGDNDDLMGGAGRDVLDGGDGINVLVGDGATVADSDRAARTSTPANQAARVALVSNIGVSSLGTAFENCVYVRPAVTAADTDTADCLTGGANDDVMFGEGGADVLVGNAGPDYQRGGAGNDVIRGDADVDEQYGDDGADTMFGGLDADTMRGNAGDDDMEGNGGVDTMHGDAGDDDMIGGSSTSAADAGDTMAGDAGADVMLGDNGTIDASDVVALLDLDSTDTTLAGEDTMNGNADNDRMYGGGAKDTMRGDAGADYLEGNGGPDDMFGNADADRMIGGSSVSALDEGDTMYGDDADDVMLGDNGTISDAGVVALLDLSSTDGTLYGNDVMTGGAGNDRMYGGGAQDVQNGNAGDDYLEGNPGADLMYGDAHDDDLIGGTSLAGIPDDAHDFGGDVGTVGDRMNGGEGDDVLTGDNASVTRPSPQTTHPASDGGAKVRNVTLFDVATTTDAATQGAGDRMSGDGGSDWLFGQAGDDTIDGGASQDLAQGNDGVDTISGGDAIDLLVGGTTQHAALEQAGAAVTFGVALDKGDTITGGAADDILLGDNVEVDWAGQATFLVPTPAGTFGVDTINGNDGDDRIWGQLDGDFLYGDAGHDYVAGDLAAISPTETPLGHWPSGAPRYDVVLVDPDTGGADTITGNTGADHLFGGAAVDTVQGGLDDDYLEGNNGNDVLYGLSATSDDGVLDATDAAEQAALLVGSDEDDIIGGSSSASHPGPVRRDTGETLIQGNADHDVIAGDNADISRVRTEDGSAWAADDFIPGARKRTVVLLDREKTGDDLAAVSGGDTAEGNGGSDRIFGEGGDDTLKGNANDDMVEGDQGSDWIEGNGGEDDLVGGSTFLAASPDQGDPDGVDFVYGGADADVMLGDNGVIGRSAAAAGEPLYFTTSGRLLGFTTPRWVRLYDLTTLDASRFGGDRISGGSGADVGLGQDGDDWMSGGSEADYLEGNGATDRIYGDRMLSDASITGVPAAPAHLPSAASTAEELEGVQGPAGQDDLIGGSSKPAHRDAGDFLYGDGAADFELGDNGELIRTIAGSAYTTYVEANTTTVVRLARRFDVGATTPVFGDDWLEGNDGDDVQFGQDGNDTLHGNNDNDDQYGELGDDVMFGHAGEDAMVGDRGFITNRLLDGSPGDPASFTISHPGPPFLSYVGFRPGTLDRRVDLLDDGDGAPVPMPGLTHGGKDRMRGGPGRDSMHGAFGDDLMNGDDGGDILFGDDGADVMWGGKGHPTDLANRGANDEFVDYLFGGHGGPVTDDVRTESDMLDYRPRPNLDPPAWFEMTDLHDADTTNDQHHQGVDWQYGGFDRDVMQGDLTDNGPNYGDRMIDWTGAFNLYTHCNAAYGGYNDIRALSPAMQDFLQRLAYASGAGNTLSDVLTKGTSGYRELGLVYSGDIRDNNNGKAYPTTPGHFEQIACDNS